VVCIFFLSKFSNHQLENYKFILEIAGIQNWFCVLLSGRVCGAACPSSDLQNHRWDPWFLYLLGERSRASSPGVPAGTFS